MTERSADYVILGAGIAGMTMQHVLRGTSNVLIDPNPGRYKIGESIIPVQFEQPEVSDVYDILIRLPSATPKLGALFITDDSVTAFDLFQGARTLHVARNEMEVAIAKHFGTEVIRERVESIDVGARRVVTDQGTFRANELIIDCSGPARLVSRALGLSREVWPVWASWAYHDVTAADDERFLDSLRRGDKPYLRFNEAERRIEPSPAVGTFRFRPSHSTILTQVADGVWTWQIPLYRASMLSVGVVSRHGPIGADEYRDVVARSTAPCFQVALRPWNGSGHFNAFHVRNRFAWASDAFAGESWALVGDAAFFGDPVYSVGTGFATNHAIQLGRLLLEHGFSPKVRAAHQRHTAYLYQRAKLAADCWYFGRTVSDVDTASEIQTQFLRGRAFQVLAPAAFVDMWAIAAPDDALNETAPWHGEPAAQWLTPLLEPGGVLAGWQLTRARAFKSRLELEWERPDAPSMFLSLVHATASTQAFRVIDGLAMSYRTPQKGSARLGGQENALLAAFVGVMASHGDRLRSIMEEALHD